MSFIFRKLSNFIFRTRSFNNASIEKFAKSVKNKTILELGSGKKLNGKYYYSAKKFFDESNTFIQSDINKNFGHKIIDVTTMNYNKKFDIIICMNVLEHVYDFQTGIKNIYQALKPKGITVIFVPGFYPLHDEPHDYWRFTEHSLKLLLKDFKKVKIIHSGIRQYPFAYHIEAQK